MYGWSLSRGEVACRPRCLKEEQDCRVERLASQRLSVAPLPRRLERVLPALLRTMLGGAPPLCSLCLGARCGVYLWSRSTLLSGVIHAA